LNNSRIEEYDKMDLLKALKRTTIISAAAVLAFGATEASALENVAFLGHISASVTSVLQLTEISAVKFGNFKDGAGTVVLSPTGTRTSTGAVTLLNGSVNAGGGVVDGTDQETGSQAPGFYEIRTDVGQQPADVYITFADNTGNIIDPVNHPDNFVQLDGPAADHHLIVNKFTFAADDGVTSTSGTGYTGTASTPDAIYGDHVQVNGTSDRIRVGATLTDSGGAAAGRYTGTFFIMASY
jgi:hypothetical protein